MPIVVEYGAPAPLGGAVAHQAGLGQFRQRQSQFDQQNQQFAEQQALREQEMALRQQAQAIQQEQFGQQFQLKAEQANIDNLYRQQAFNYGRRKDRAAVGIAARERDQNRAATLQLEQMRQQAGMEEQKQKLLAQIEDRRVQQELLNVRDEARLEAEEEERSWDWDVGSAKEIDASVDQRFADLRKMELNEAGQQRLNEFATKVAALKSQRNNLRPGRYAERMSELMESVEGAGWDDYVVEPMTIQSEFLGWDEEQQAEHDAKGFKKGRFFQDVEDGTWFVEGYDSSGKPKFKFREKNTGTPEDPKKIKDAQNKERERALADLKAEFEVQKKGENYVGEEARDFSIQEIDEKITYNRNRDNTLVFSQELREKGIKVEYPQGGENRQQTIQRMMNKPDGTFFVDQDSGILYVILMGQPIVVDEETMQPGYIEQYLSENATNVSRIGQGIESANQFWQRPALTPLAR